jgi:hypothetical protein
MTTFTTEDLDSFRKDLPKPGSVYRGTDSEEFEIKALYTPNEDPDAWVSYTSRRTQVEYSCRLEAFLNRFTRVEQ